MRLRFEDGREGGQVCRGFYRENSYESTQAERTLEIEIGRDELNLKDAARASIMHRIM